MDDEDQNDQHVDLLEAFLCSETKFQMLLDSYDTEFKNSPSYYKVMFGIFTSYVLGDYDNSHTYIFIAEYLNALSEEFTNFICDDCKENEKTMEVTVEKSHDDKLNIVNENGLIERDMFELEKTEHLNSFMSMWDNYLCENVSAEKICEIYDKISSGVVDATNSSDFDGSELIEVKIAKQIFQLQSFRKIISLQQKCKNGTAYMKDGLFKIFPSLKSSKTNEEYDQYLNAMETIFDDVSCHNSLVDYVCNILESNTPYTYEDMRFITLKWCSTNSFNLFIQKILLKLVEKYNLDTIVSTLKTSNTEDSLYKYFVKLYNALLNSLTITHSYMLRRYFILQSSLTDIDKIYVKGSKQHSSEKKKTTKEIQKIVNLLDKKNNSFIQEIFINACYLSDQLNDENMYLNLVTYVDRITSFKNTEVFYGDTNQEIFKCLTYIVGNIENKQVNPHMRYYACSIILKLIKVEGFGAFNNLFENLFKYISEVKFSDWTHPDDAIDHQFRLVEAIYMLTDFYTNELKGSRDMIAGALYILLKKGIEMFEEIHQISEILKKKRIYVSGNTEYFAKLVSVIEITLKTHQNVYDNGIIKQVYPEVENTYSILIGELLSAVLNCEHELYTFLARPELAGKITKASMLSINSHINFCSTYLQKIKDTIKEALERFNAHVTEKDKEKILTLLSFDELEIDYPAEFLDPLLNTPIVDPVKIPNVPNYIFDKVGIVTHIHNSKENPYTREPLTIQMLEDFNKKPEILEELNSFLEKKKIFAEEYKNLKSNSGDLQTNTNI